MKLQEQDRMKPLNLRLPALPRTPMSLTTEVSRYTLIPIEVHDRGEKAHHVWGTSLNNCGEVTGTATFGPHHHQKALRWRQGAASCFSSHPASLSYGDAINDYGIIVGRASTPTHQIQTVYFEPSGISELHPHPPRFQVTQPRAINNLNQVAGEANGAFIFDGSVFKRVPWVVRFTAINDAGMAAGTAFLDGEYVGVLYNVYGDELISIRGLSGNTHLWGINASGDVIGVSQGTDNAPHAFISKGIETIDLGVAQGFSSSMATSINGTSMVVGGMFAHPIHSHPQVHAFIWTRSSGMLDLNNLLCDNPKHITLEHAYDINDLGQILVTARNGESYLLQPIQSDHAQILFYKSFWKHR